MNVTPIIVESLGKRFRIGSAPTKANSLGGAFLGKLTAPFSYLKRSLRKATEEETLWALRDVSFSVEKGEALGIVGRNGAGKTTLLKILSRITDPTEGRALINGRVGSLLQVGTGFHPELTGRENIYLNGAIMGMRRHEIRAKFDEMINFAEVAKFIDTPVKYYSSGMYVRLAFSVAAHLEPEILIVDEVLAVGDVSFQKKCLGKMGSEVGQGRTVLLVSHNMEAILGLCSRTIWLDNGKIRDDGDPKEVVHNYTKTSVDLAKSGSFINEENRPGHGRLRFTGLEIRDRRGRAQEFHTCGEPLDLVLHYRTNGEPLDSLSVWVWIRDYLGRELVCLWNQLTGDKFSELGQEGHIICSIPKLPLTPGTYIIDLNAVAGGLRSDRVLNAAILEIAPGDFYKHGSGPVARGPSKDRGVFLCDHSWSQEA